MSYIYEANWLYSLKYPCDIPWQCDMAPELILNVGNIIWLSIIIAWLLLIFCKPFRYYIISAIGGDFGIPGD